MKKRLFACLLVILCALTLFASVPVSASEPYQTYTYSADGFALYSPAAYAPVKSITYKDMGLDTPFDDATDLFVDKRGKVYLVDKANNRVIVMKNSDDYAVDFVLSAFVNEAGNDDVFSSPQGVFVDNEYIYVCDTGMSRIVLFDLDGNFARIIPEPQSPLFGESFVYKPIAMAVDQYGRIYVISSETGEGVIVMDKNGNFNGFIGAQSVSYDVFDIIWRRFQTAEQRAQSVTYIPQPFNNIAIDEEGFVYVTHYNDDESDQIASIQSKSASHSPIKKLNSAGDEIMKRNGFFDPGGEVDVKRTSKTSKVKAEYSGASKIVDVGIGPEDTWSIIDQKRSKVFTYDSNGNLLFAFGDKGEQLGNMSTLAAVAYKDNYMLLLDSGVNDRITIYERTEYGDMLIEALACENNREYDKAIECWISVLQRNNNFDTAYIGIGKALYRESNYEEAMEYLGSAYETEYYSKAYQELRKEWISKYFILIPLILAAVIVAWVFFKKYVKRVNYETAHSRTKRTYKQELLYAFHLMYHPFDGFWDLKHEKRGSLRAALTILGIVIVCFFYQSIGTGYLLNPHDNYSTILVQILAVGVPLLLWAISNWCLTTLFDGEGSFKDIVIACCYALAPMPVLLIVSTLLSNIVTLNEAQIISLLVTLGYIWMAFLIFFGMMVTHDYSMYKTILTTLGTVVAMAVIMFMAVLFTSLLGKILSFVTSIYTELSYRV